ncbi:glutaredoxin family protein [Rhodococcus sp. 05-340-1]|jgi:glutaredoxin|uniref:glutaredoxin family protein n=1 Tax=Nocardiaceae TaxID=85025 RepID=UPI00055EF75B|nr:MULTISPECIES: glutaredoxin family protein [Rhodococcus]MDV8021769.1 glutaredoxin family protein [Rhodococcus sp. IEGM 1330]OZD72597.1 glutaredoxin family protein [Rhodococcus sp. 05-340-2]OZD76278.1 glutaredoxin family protein [Rhodococcus sp. 05-340-1]OZE91557.1 glutaredoxin family protein [Rhodococcus sp. 15-2388-1-1a]OZF32790.1 glutaredoxin family protein [Rhodococcus sp. 14-2483-1-2]
MQTTPTGVALLTRAGCHSCTHAFEVLSEVCREFDVAVTVVDVDEAAAESPDLRAEYGDRVPVVLLDGIEHSYWEVDVPRLRADLARAGHPKNV